jgi:CRISPR-associated protein Csx16
MSQPPHLGALPRCIVVTRHKATAAWLQGRFPDATVIPHLDPATIEPGDTVIGTLPLHVAAAVTERGASLLHLALEIPADERGKDITAQDLERYGARLMPLEVRAPPLVTGWRYCLLAAWRCLTQRAR